MPKKPPTPKRSVPVAELRKLVVKWRETAGTSFPYTAAGDMLCDCARDLDRLIKEAR
jgi:hypothetical protein